MKVLYYQYAKCELSKSAGMLVTKCKLYFHGTVGQDGTHLFALHINAG